jgi:F-type H+-transporting ATPase subunit delta
MKASRKITRDATQLFRACLVGGVLDEGRVRAVVQRLAAARPRGYLAMLAVFRRLVNLKCLQHTARIESARPLPDDLRAEALKRLAATYGSGLSTSFAEDPALIGGLRIQVGSDVYDGSVRGRLAALERSF